MSEGNGTYKELATEVIRQLGRLEGKLDAYELRTQALERQSAVFENLAQTYIPAHTKLDEDFESFKSWTKVRFALLTGGATAVAFGAPFIVRLLEKL